MYKTMMQTEIAEPPSEKPALPSVSVNPDSHAVVTTATVLPESSQPKQLLKEMASQPGKKSRAIIGQFRQQKNTMTLADLHTAGKNFLAMGFLQDAHLTFHYAATKGHLASIIILAAANDPTLVEQTDKFLDEPDPEQAFKWYKQAHSQGFLNAASHLQAIRTWAKKAASSGNKTAKLLLLQWLTQPSEK